jgi:hypothetical protein
VKVLILGGYGTFGGRLAQLVADEPRLTLVIAGRSLDQAAAFCAVLPARARLEPAVVDRDGDVEAALRRQTPDLVVDASGPFQHYGEAPYRVIAACLACGVNYLDLADGSEFVEGVARFDEEARARGVFVLAGVSSFPVLTAAVVRRLSHDMTQVQSVWGGIAPSPYAGVGQNVIRAIASYAGKPVRAGGVEIGHALTDARRFTIAPPGRLPLHPIRFSLVDVPDHQALRALWPELRSVWMGAGPVPQILHRALNGLAWLVRLRLLPSLSPVAGVMYRAINVLRWGEHRGGMFVSVSGTNADGGPIERTRSWHLVAERDHGPLIPSMAAEAIIRHCLDGRRPPAGARAAVRELELEDYEALFARRTIVTGTREPVPANASLYQSVLGTAWNDLPPAIQSMHDVSEDTAADGMASIERGTGLLARLVATLFRFPERGESVPVRVDFLVRDGREVWQRSFAGRRFTSTQEQGRGRFDGLIVERFGPFAFGLALVAEDGRLTLVLRRWTAFGLPLPVSLSPGGHAYESEQDGRFHFHVEIGQRWTGLIVRYRGWLKPNR